MRQRKETFFRDKGCVACRGLVEHSCVQVAGHPKADARVSGGEPLHSKALTCKTGLWGTRQQRTTGSENTRLRCMLAGLETGAYKCGASLGLALPNAVGVKPAYRRQAAPYKESVAAGSGAFSCAKGHCRISRVQIRNARKPRAISRSPHLRMGPVCQKSQAQASMVRTAGNG